MVMAEMLLIYCHHNSINLEVRIIDVNPKHNECKINKTRDKRIIENTMGNKILGRVGQKRKVQFHPTLIFVPFFKIFIKLRLFCL